MEFGRPDITRCVCERFSLQRRSGSRRAHVGHHFSGGAAKDAIRARQGSGLAAQCWRITCGTIGRKHLARLRPRKQALALDLRDNLRPRFVPPRGRARRSRGPAPDLGSASASQPSASGGASMSRRWMGTIAAGRAEERLAGRRSAATSAKSRALCQAPPAIRHRGQQAAFGARSGGPTSRLRQQATRSLARSACSGRVFVGRRGIRSAARVLFWCAAPSH